MLLAGEPLISRTCRRVRAQVAGILICANRNASEYLKYGQVVTDGFTEFRGPLAGIAAALAACPTPWLMTVPVDGPALPDDLLYRMSARIGESDGALAVAYDGTRRQPLFALYRRSLAASAQVALHDNAPVWRWQDECGAVDVDFSDEAERFVNLNSPEEFRRWELLHHG